MPKIDKSKLAVLRNASTAAIHNAATTIVEQSEQDSTVFDAEAAAKIPRFDLDELKMGHVLGRGGFCVVRELTGIKINENNDDSHQPKKTSFQKIFGLKEDNLDPADILGDDSDMESVTSASESEINNGIPRESFAQRIARPRKKGACGCGRYVVKEINTDFQYTDKVNYLKAIVDIQLEAKYMASLRHPNILRLRGFANPGLATGQSSFLILDRLEITLSKKMSVWLRLHRQCRGITGAFVGSKKKREGLLVQRLVAAHNIADAVDYLHNKGIIFRDLKPDNIGFDAHETLKLFDFGLAREIKERDRYKDTDLFHMTGFTGAIRYMAPEVGLRRPYNTKADVYSWSQLMWYILELEPPLGVYTPHMFVERVFKQGTRPAVMKTWPEHMPALMQMCWSDRPSDRPSFTEIKDHLSVILLPYNTKKVVKNRFQEELILSGVKNEATASIFESSAPRACPCSPTADCATQSYS